MAQLWSRWVGVPQLWHAHVLARRGDSSSRHGESIGGIESQRTPESEARDESWRWEVRAGTGDVRVKVGNLAFWG